MPKPAEQSAGRGRTPRTPRYVGGWAMCAWIVLVGVVAARFAVLAESRSADRPPVATRNGPPQVAGQFNVDVWDTRDGLPQVSVTAIAQTPDGYLWLGTLGGLVRFDGVTFRVYDAKDGLAKIRVVELKVDRTGALWIRSDEGGLARMVGGRITNYPLRDYLEFPSTDGMVEDSTGRMWVVADHRVLTFKDGRVTRYTPKEGLPDVRYLNLWEDRQGGIWFATDRELVRFRDGRFASFGEREGFPVGVISDIHCAADGTLLIGCEGRLLRYAEGRFTDVTPPGIAASDPVHLREVGGVLWCAVRGRLMTLDRDGKPTGVYASAGFMNTQQNLLVDRSGAFWYGFRRDPEQGGIACFQNGVETRYRIRDGSTDDVVRAVFEDREGSIWGGTNRSGLFRLRPNRVVVVGKPEGLKGENLYPVMQDAAGTVWVGSQDSQILCGITGGRIASAPVMYPLTGTFNGGIWALGRRRDGTLLVGTFGGDLLEFRNGRFIRCSVLSERQETAVLAVLEDSRGRLWVGTMGNGLVCAVNGRVNRLTRAEGIPGNQVQQIVEAPDGTLWIGTQTGLGCLRDGRPVSFPGGDFLANDSIRAIHLDPDGTLWLGTYGNGLVRLRNGIPVRITTRSGLFHNTVHRILEDDRGNFWINSNGGIFRVSRAELNAVADGRALAVSCYSLTTADGVRNIEGNGGCQPAGWKTTDGKLWFPTQAGVVIIDPAMPLNRIVPPVAVEQIVMNERREDIPDNKTVTLPLGQRVFQITYTGLSFLNPDKVLFRYRLDGFDPDWQNVGTRRTAYYTNVGPGTYRFQVLACNNDGIWNETGDVVTIVVPPYVYETRWFLAICLLAVGFMGFGGYQWRVRRFARRERELHELVTRRTRSLADAQAQTVAALDEIKSLNLRLEDANRALHDENRMERDRAVVAESEARQAQLEMLRYQLNPHFLFNVLNTIFGLIGFEPKRARLMVRELSDFLRYSLNAPHSGTVALREEIAATRHFLEIQKIRFDDRLMVEFDISPEVETRSVPAFILQPLVENAVKYGMHPDVPLTVRVAARIRRGRLEVRVANSGRWTEPESVGRRRTGTGIGLRNVVERLNRLFPERSDFRVVKGRGWVTVRIRIWEVGIKPA